MSTTSEIAHLAEQLRKGTAGLSLYEIEALWGEAATALEAVSKKRQITGDRFFIDHGQIHDRVTGRHVTTDEDSVFCDGINSALELLNGLDARLAELETALATSHDLSSEYSKALLGMQAERDELERENARMLAALHDVDATTPTQSSVVAARAHITPAQAECQQALANIGDIARAALAPEPTAPATHSIAGERLEADLSRASA
jgi:uncharacterized coiled-coil protein SlyX